MSDAQRQVALDLLGDPKLIARIDQDLDTLGLVGARANRLVCYLACVSRLMPRPLSVPPTECSVRGVCWSVRRHATG